MIEPQLNHYPQWLQSYIEKRLSSMYNCIPAEQCGKELLGIYDESRKNPIAKVLFYLVIEVIWQEFQLWDLRKKIEHLRMDIAKVKASPFTKREIKALQVCAAEKMNEATPEEEAEWDRALNDPYGDS